ncbi:hypothetical protein ACFL2J_04810 [Candidatus Omnitrophota bacterium]
MFKKARFYRSGRICKVSRCKTILSRYNPRICCSIHSEDDVKSIKKAA